MHELTCFSRRVIPKDAGTLSGHLLALLGGVCYPLAFAPFGFWWVGLISFIAFLFSLDVESKRDIFIRYYLFALGMYGTGVSWIFVSINVFGGVSPFVAGLLILLFVLSYSVTSLIAAILHVNTRNWLLTFPAIWVVLEWFRSWFLTGFPWLFAGYSHLDSPLSGYIPIVGVYGLSFFTVLTAVLLYNLRSTTWVLNILILGVLWGGGAFIAERAIWVNPTEEVIKVSAIQGNVDQHTKWLPNSANTIIKSYLRLTEEEWGRDVIVWPEAAITVIRQDAETFLKELEEQGRKTGTTLLLGILDRPLEGQYFNSVIALGEGSGVYHKRRLVPFGEYVPFEKYLRGAIEFFDLPMSHSQAGYYRQGPLMAGKYAVSVLICYEVVYPQLLGSDSFVPDMFVTVSNDTWFGRSIGPKQHLQMARMRATEYGRWMIRSTNNGITVLIDHQGSLKAKLEPFEEGIMRGELRIMQGVTPYHHFGYWPLIIICLTIIFVSIIRHRLL